MAETRLDTSSQLALKGDLTSQSKSYFDPQAINDPAQGEEMTRLITSNYRQVDEAPISPAMMQPKPRRAGALNHARLAGTKYGKFKLSAV